MNADEQRATSNTDPTPASVPRSSFRDHRSSLARPLLILAALLALSLVLGIAFGDVQIAWNDELSRTILLRLRMPRVLLAAAIGATLAVAGVTFQTLLRNPLADPFILGVSGGAAAGAAVATALRWSRIPGVVPLVAFLGACGATAAVFLLARRRDHTDPTRLLLSGLVLNAFFSAIILISFSLSRQADLTAALRWMMGSLFGATWVQVAIVVVPLVLAMLVLAFTANDLRLLAFGEEDAKSRGVDVERVKLIGFGTASIITGAAVAVSGIIGFVGLLVPHLIRLIWRRDFRFLLPLCALGGAILVVGADVLSRVLVRNVDLPIGAFTAILGVPLFLSLLRRSR
jgi:iron complex transport system permease protein